uniref:Uncharacterized protein n=1 Tax=Micrurus lemniscatus lemniscatus TaxID=129467 RepID=A0A2D4ITF6_MICLE
MKKIQYFFPYSSRAQGKYSEKFMVKYEVEARYFQAKLDITRLFFSEVSHKSLYRYGVFFHCFVTEGRAAASDATLLSFSRITSAKTNNFIAGSHFCNQTSYPLGLCPAP